MIAIKTIRLHHLQMTLNNPFLTSFGTVQEKDFFVVEVVDEDGRSGYGESVAFTTPWYTEETTATVIHMLENILIPLLRERRPSHPDEMTEIFAPIKRHHMAKAALEGAIWDVYAKQQGISLAKALGGNRSEIAVGISLGMAPMEKLLRQIAHYSAAGYKRIKIKIKPGRDVAVVEEIRRHFPDLPLMVDANSAYTLNDLDHLRQLDAFDLMMIEQPLTDHDILDHATLQAALATPICLDESIHSLADVKMAIELGSCQIINIKAGRVGGLTVAKRIHDYCQAHNVAVWCGGMLDAGVGRAHNIALSTLSNFVLPGDIGASSHYWKKDIILPEVTVKNGFIKVPDEPGIGYEVNWDALHTYRVGVKEFSM